MKNAETAAKMLDSTIDVLLMCNEETEPTIKFALEHRPSAHRFPQVSSALEFFQFFSTHETQDLVIDVTDLQARLSEGQFQIVLVLLKNILMHEPTKWRTLTYQGGFTYTGTLTLVGCPHDAIKHRTMLTEV